MKKKDRFETRWGWENDDRFVFFCWSVPNKTSDLIVLIITDLSQSFRKLFLKALNMTSATPLLTRSSFTELWSVFALNPTTLHSYSQFKNHSLCVQFGSFLPKDSIALGLFFSSCIPLIKSNTHSTKGAMIQSRSETAWALCFSQSSSNVKVCVNWDTKSHGNRETGSEESMVSSCQSYSRAPVSTVNV